MLLRCESLEPPMSELGHSRHSHRLGRVRFAPRADIQSELEQTR
jgi:hypothetical protein